MNERSLNNNPAKAKKEESFHLISEIHKAPHLTQREISSKLKISLGKTNYLLKELVKKGVIKAKNFSRNPSKLVKIKYILTRKGFQEKIRLTKYFLERKEAEYNLLRKEWEKLCGKTGKS